MSNGDSNTAAFDPTRAQGLELSLRAVPVEGLRLRARYALLDGEVIEWSTVLLLPVTDGLVGDHHGSPTDRDMDETDHDDDMDEIAQRFATQVAAPLVLDSTEPQVMEAGLQWIGGRAILNSANLEDGDRIFDPCHGRILPGAR